MIWKHVRLEEYRGLKGCDLENLGKINVICGRNNSGKSTVLEALSGKAKSHRGIEIDPEKYDHLVSSFLKDARFPNTTERMSVVRKSLKDLVEQRAVWYDNDDREFLAYAGQKVDSQLGQGQFNAELAKEGFLSLFEKNPSTLLIPPKRSFEPFPNHKSDSPSVSPSGKGIVDQLFLWKNQPSGDDERNHLRNLEDAFSKVTDGINFTVTLRKDNSTLELRFFKPETRETTADLWGLGLQDVLCLVYWSIEPKQEVVLIEEPEAHIHPEMQRRMLDLFHNVPNKQFILATHSSVFLDGTYTEKVFLTNYLDEIKIQDTTSKAEALGELGYSALDNLLSDLVILVEGPRDKPIIEELLPKFDIDSRYLVKIWPLGGDIMDQIDLQPLVESHKVVAIIDGDPKSAKIRNRFVRNCKNAGIIHVTRLKKYAIENYFTPRVLKEVLPNYPEGLDSIDPKRSIKEQIGFDVKGNNRKLAQALTIDEIDGTDLAEFFRLIKNLLEGEDYIKPKK